MLIFLFSSLIEQLWGKSQCLLFHLQAQMKCSVNNTVGCNIFLFAALENVRDIKMAKLNNGVHG